MNYKPRWTESIQSMKILNIKNPNLSYITSLPLQIELKLWSTWNHVVSTITSCSKKLKLPQYRHIVSFWFHKIMRLDQITDHHVLTRKLVLSSAFLHTTICENLYTYPQIHAFLMRHSEQKLKSWLSVPCHPVQVQKEIKSTLSSIFAKRQNFRMLTGENHN